MRHRILLSHFVYFSSNSMEVKPQTHSDSGSKNLVGLFPPAQLWPQKRVSISDFCDEWQQRVCIIHQSQTVLEIQIPWCVAVCVLGELKNSLQLVWRHCIVQSRMVFPFSLRSSSFGLPLPPCWLFDAIIWQLSHFPKFFMCDRHKGSVKC